MNLRSTAPLLLLPLEGILLGLMFDAEALATLSGGWARVIGHIASQVMPLAAAIATSGLILAGPRIRDELRTAPPTQRSRLRAAAWWVAHGAGFASLVILSKVLFGHPPPQRHAGAYAAAWVIAAALTVSLLGRRAFLPAALRSASSSRTPGDCCSRAAACGLLAWAAGQYTQHWWGPLRRATLLTSAAILRVFDATASADPPNT